MTGSRRIDVALVVFDGIAEPTPIPDALRQPGRGFWDGDQVRVRAEGLIDEVFPVWSVTADAPAGTRFEFTVRWSEGSIDLDKQETIVRTAARAR